MAPRTTNRRSARMAASACALALSATLAACGGGGDGAEAGGDRTLSFGYHTGEMTPIGQVWAWWMDEVESRTDGSITFDPYWDGTLVKGPDIVESLTDGRVDVSQVMPTLYTTTFPVTSVHELPFQSSNSPAVSAAMAELASDEDGAVAQEFEAKGLHPLAWAIGGSSALGTKDAIESVDDLDGVRIRGNDRSSKVMGAAGANIINMELADVYGSLDRGLIDGVYGVPFGFVGPLKYAEVVKNFTDTGMGVASANALTMSQELWDSLSDEQRDAIAEVNAEVPGKIAEFDAQFDAQSCEAVKEAGAELHVLDEAEVERLRDAGYDTVLAEWKEAAGSDADAVLADYQAAVAAAEGDYPDYETGVASCFASQ
ncbi:TRAP transporter substrate-binding protein DctP [Nocardioides hwasunensis]|uniref:TRAP transporter substrate-binding protein DctP n=1 Tax=Nocardioides hwasunensis TaxID=397258 RepID=A0ABR8MQE9_9ACTN|nr:TRAP transporter substrate-binding protein DctP [Nocardioides hwasunensis]MBD3917055.1 TRAP transporter substrate-binding protein DctP [Nocardioides hwasunensis]